VNRPARTTGRLMTINEVATMLQIPVGTMYQWRHRGLGPAGFRIGRHVRYRLTDVEAWLDRQAVDDNSHGRHRGR